MISCLNSDKYMFPYLSTPGSRISRHDCSSEMELCSNQQILESHLWERHLAAPDRGSTNCARWLGLDRNFDPVSHMFGCKGLGTHLWNHSRLDSFP